MNKKLIIGSIIWRGKKYLIRKLNLIISKNIKVNVITNVSGKYNNEWTDRKLNKE